MFKTKTIVMYRLRVLGYFSQTIVCAKDLLSLNDDAMDRRTTSPGVIVLPVDMNALEMGVAKTVI
jgi:hypothetical protein